MNGVVSIDILPHIYMAEVLTQRIRNIFGNAPVHEPPNMGFPRALTLDVSIAENGRRFAGRSLNDPDAYAIRVEPGQSGQIQVIITFAMTRTDVV